MILPVVAYGDPVLKKRASSISKDYPKINSLISDMYDTMYGANGVGLAAPQIGLSIRLFLVDTEPFSEELEEPTEIVERPDIEPNELGFRYNPNKPWDALFPPKE